MFMQDIRQFEAATQVSALSQPLAGLPGATLIETAAGWRPAAALRPGDEVAVWEGGFRPLTAVRSGRVAPADVTMIRVPGGAINNCGTVWLRPDQHVLIRSPFAAAVLEAEAVLLPAAALAGFRGIESVAPRMPITLAALHFDEDEVIFAASGLNLHCPAVGAAPLKGAEYCGCQPVLDETRARDLLALIGGGAMTSDGYGCAA